LRQSAEVAHGGHRTVARAEEWPVPHGQGREGVRNALDQRCGQLWSAHAVTSRWTSVISPLQSRIRWLPSDSTLGSGVKSDLAAVRPMIVVGSGYHPRRNVIVSN
jgi:hypothetical protein